MIDDILAAELPMSPSDTVAEVDHLVTDIHLLPNQNVLEGTMIIKMIDSKEFTVMDLGTYVPDHLL